MLTLITFILILSFLVFVHELGHFIAAKRAKITVEEFAIGFPPRLAKVWQDEGKITLNGESYIIGRRTRLPRNLQVGSQVQIETRQRPDSQAEITKIEVIAPERDDAESANPSAMVVDGYEKPTEYSLNWIPFGGYVKMVGEEDPSAPGSFASKSKRARFVVLVAGAVMNLITAVLTFTVMFSTGIPEPIGGTYILNVLPNSPGDESGILAGDVIVQADETAIANHTELAEYVGAHRGEEINLRIQRNGQEISLNVTPRVNPPIGEGAIGVEIGTVGKATIVDVLPNSIAAEAGLQSRDIILQADDLIIRQASQLTAYFNEQIGQNVTLVVQRGDEENPTETTVNLVPAANPDTGRGAIGVQLGNQAIEQRLNRLSLGQSLLSGTLYTSEIVMQTFLVPIAVLRNAIPAEQARPVGPVGIFSLTDSAVDASVETGFIYPILLLTAIISTALAVTNLLPLPALDGGRILFIFIEAIRGKRVSPEKEGLIHFVGLALLLTLMVVVSYNDISNPIDVPDWTTLF